MLNMKNDPMKILIITGGIGGEITEAVNYYKLFRLIYPSSEIKVVFLYKLKMDLDIDYEDINVNRSLNPLLKLRNIIIWIKKVIKIKREFKPDLSISLCDPSNLVNLISSIYLSNYNNIIRICGLYSNLKKYQGDNYLYGILYKIMYVWIYKIIANPKYTKLATFINKLSEIEFRRLLGVNSDKLKIKTVYNPICLTLIEERLKENLEEYSEIFAFPVIITLGRLTKPKGQWYLLRIFKELKKHKEDLKLVVLGDGELKDYLYNLSLDLGLRTFIWDRSEFKVDYDVFFLGFQKNPFKFIAKSKLFVFPSLWEGSPYALVEAMACGVPVISSDCRSGPREILAPNTSPEHQTTEPEFTEYGVLMPVFDGKFKTASEPLTEVEKEWIDTIKLLLSEDTLRDRLSTGAKVRVKDFELTKITEEWRRLIEEVGNR